MKKLILLLILISIIFSISVEKPWNYEKWEKENPDIMNVVGLKLYNTWVFQFSLDQMNISEMEYSGDTEVDGILTKMKGSYSDAQLKNSQCWESEFIWLNACYSILNMFDIWKTLEGYWACFEYGGAWKETMNYAMEIVEESQETVETEINELEKNYENLEESGVCDEDYVNELEICEKAKNALENYNGEFVYGEESVFYDVYSGFRNLSHISSYTPDLGSYPVYFSSVWDKKNGVLVLSQEMNGEIVETLEQEKEYVDEIIEESKDSLKERKKEFELLEKQKLEKIISGTELDEYLGEEIISIKEEFESIETELGELKESIEEAEDIYEEENQDYLKESVILAEGGVEGLEELRIRIEIIEEEATGVVESKREKVAEEIDDFEGEIEGNILSKETEELYKTSKGYFEDGENDEILGEKYENYYNSMKYLSLAKASFEKEEGETELEFLTLVGEVEKLLKGAKKDGLNVGYEEVEFGYLKKHQSLEFYNELEGLKESIIEKSKIRFGYLEKEIIEVEEIAQIAAGELDYLLSEFYEKKNEVFEQNKIDYEKGIGKLKNFESEYFEVKGKIEGMLEKIMLKKVESKIETTIKVGYVDQESVVRNEIFVNNKANYNFEKLEVELTLPFEMMIYSENIIYGDKNLENILVNGNKFKLYLNSIESGTKYYFVIENEEEIVRTTSFERKVKGSVDGSAEIEEKRTVFVDYELESLELPEFWGKINSIELDGEEIESSSGIIEKNIGKGKHVIESKSILNNVFEYNKTNVVVSSIGTKNQVSYDIIITPKIDLDSAVLLIGDGFNENVEELKVISYTSEEIKNKQFFKNGGYSFEIFGLEEGVESVVKVSYLVDNSSAYLEDEIKKVEKIELDEYENELLDEVRNKMNESKMDDAISTIKELQNIIENRQNVEYKLQKKYDDLVEGINSEWEEIGEALGNGLGEFNDSFVYKLENRYEELGEILAKNKSISEKIDEMEGVDQKWLEKERKSFVKEKYKEYNKIKGEFIESGIEEYESKLRNFEELLIQFEVKGNLEDVGEVLEGLKSLEKTFEGEKTKSGGEYLEYKEEYDSIVSGIKSKLSAYSKQQTQAEGTSYEYLFNYSKKEVENRIIEIEKEIKNKENTGKIQTGIGELGKIELNINEVMDYLEKESKRRVGNLEIYSNSVPEEKKAEITKSIEELDILVSKGEYLAALKGSEIVMEEISGSKKSGEDLFLIGIVALVILSLIGVVLLKERIGIKKETTKESKKLKRVE